MKVRVLRSFNDHQPGDVFECPDATAVLFVQQHLVVRVAEEPELATAPLPEMSISRRGRR